MIKQVLKLWYEGLIEGTKLIVILFVLSFLSLPIHLTLAVWSEYEEKISPQSWWYWVLLGIAVLWLPVAVSLSLRIVGLFTKTKQARF